MHKSSPDLTVTIYQTQLCVVTSDEADQTDISQAETVYSEMLVVLDEIISLKKNVIADGDIYLQKFRSYFDKQQSSLSASNLAYY